MTAQLVARVSVGQCSPALASLALTALADLEAKLTGALSVQASITLTPPTLATSLSAALELVASLQASIALGLPGVSVNFTAILSVIAELNASIAVLIALQQVMLTAGVYVLTHHGASPTYGPEMQAKISAIAPPQNNVHSVTFLATDPAVFEALGKVLLTG